MRRRDRTWDELLFYESPQFTTAKYKSFHGGEVNAAKLAEIGSAFRQGRLFHESFEAADFVVRPLILYYSLLALARGLILFLEPNKRESQLAQSHGLSCKGWGEFLNSQTSEFGELKVKIENGTFSELLTATKNTNLIRANSSAVNYHVSAQSPPQGLEISFKSLCQRIADLAPEYEKWTGEKVIALKLETMKVNNGKLELKVQNIKSISGLDQLTEDYIRQIFPKTDSLDTAAGALVVDESGIQMLSGIIELAPFQIGDAVVMPRIQNEIISDLGILFLASYVLGMMARYHPSHWVAVQSIGPKGRLFPYCMRLLDYIGSNYPRAIADVLANLDRLK